MEGRNLEGKRENDCHSSSKVNGPAQLTTSHLTPIALPGFLASHLPSPEASQDE